MPRPPHLTNAEWADYKQCQADHDDLMAQVANREAQMERSLIDAYEEYEFVFTSPVRPLQEPLSGRQIPPLPLRPSARGSRRGR
ncbi:hypothetical protein [Streptomyces luteolus]|uniref:Uncharacterized protein n=1 Tax=Streptomyces luteolus TaxID=3043615 RepID=A0ABT6SSN2_9ACTN|nr:hypothetical protein [Streptomyces sp. B-S-A12]MDI3418605.1 hypothetical protein [Streptomyces sp. B-S-A12]